MPPWCRVGLWPRTPHPDPPHPHTLRPNPTTVRDLIQGPHFGPLRFFIDIVSLQGGGAGNRIRFELSLQQGDVARLSARSDGDDRRIRRAVSLPESTRVHGDRPVSWRHSGDRAFRFRLTSVLSSRLVANGRSSRLALSGPGHSPVGLRQTVGRVISLGLMLAATDQHADCHKYP